jgi:hypothetical protein
VCLVCLPKTGRVPIHSWVLHFGIIHIHAWALYWQWRAACSSYKGRRAYKQKEYKNMGHILRFSLSRLRWDLLKGCACQEDRDRKGKNKKKNGFFGCFLGGVLIFDVVSVGVSLLKSNRNETKSFTLLFGSNVSVLRTLPVGLCVFVRALPHAKYYVLHVAYIRCLSPSIDTHTHAYIQLWLHSCYMVGKPLFIPVKGDFAVWFPFVFGVRFEDSFSFLSSCVMRKDLAFTI